MKYGTSNLTTNNLFLNNKVKVMNKNSEQKPNNKNKKWQLGTQPYKGARDFYPEDMLIRNYIFDIWRKICKSYGFEEYDFPVLEPYEIFAAKTGEEIVKDEMFSFQDKGGRRLAIRPELTPGTVRMLAQRYEQLIKPIKWFMIGQNYRFEKPQKGRGREFYQLEMNIFGIEKVIADFEIFCAMIDIMKAFGAEENMFKLYFSDRKLISALLNDYLKLDSNVQIKVRRQMDKRSKISKEEFFKSLKECDLSDKQIKIVENFMNSSFDKLDEAIPKEILSNNKGYIGMIELIKLLKENDLYKYCAFNPSIIRGFDYSDGLVYEIFDTNPSNTRSLFGGERFDKLIKIFGDKYELPSTGFAMGDITLVEFLKNWNLLPSLSTDIKVLVTIFSESTKKESFETAKKLREKGINTCVYLEADKLDKQLKYADRKGIPYVIILGPDEIKKGCVVVRDMRRKEQKETQIASIAEFIRL